MNNPLSHYWINSSHNTWVGTSEKRSQNHIYTQCLAFYEVLPVAECDVCHLFFVLFFTAIWLVTSYAASLLQKPMCAAWDWAAAALSVSDISTPLLYASFHDITLLIVLKFLLIVLKGIKMKGAGENILWQSVHANKEIRTSLRYSLTPYRFHFTWFTWPFCTLKTQCSAPNWLYFFLKNNLLTKL